MAKLKPGENDFATICKDLLCEWDYDLNEKEPECYSSASGKKVHWICSKCGYNWEATIDHRRNGSGCPSCAKAKRTSIPEQIVYFYILQYFSDAENCYKPEWLHRMSEIDIFIPSLCLGIEYDGGIWHRNTEKDIQKTRTIVQHGIELVRIRDMKCKPIKDGSFHIDLSSEDSDYLYMEPAIEKLFVLINKVFGIEIEPDIDVNRDLLTVLALYSKIKKRNSLAERYPEIAKEWDYNENGVLTPNQVSYGTKVQVSWKCSNPDCGNHWKASIKSRTISGSGCPICAKKIIQEKRTETFLRGGSNSLATVDPKLAEQWDYDRNLRTPDEVNIGNSKKFFWNCDKGHWWEAIITDRRKGKGCPYCSGRKAWKAFNDFGTVKPELLGEWDYNANVSLSPYVYTVGSHKKVYWICPECGESYPMSIKERTNGHGCRKCGVRHSTEKRKKAAVKGGDNSLAAKRSDLLEDWDWEKNMGIDPQEIAVGSNEIVFWKCHKCGYMWQTRIFERGTQNHGCGACSNRILWEGHNDLKAKFPELADEWDEKKNGIPASKIHPGNKKLGYWWKCQKCGTEWEAVVRERISGKQKCPKCFPKCKLLNK